MLRDTPAKCDRGRGGARRRLIFELLNCIRSGTRIAVAVCLLAGFGMEALWAETTPVPGALTVHRSTRAVPHKFTVHPDGATVAANQTQRFEVTDAQGRPVAVRWNVSGIGCFGAACGTIDKQGVYRTPSSLPQPRVVILEAVLVADPNYSVLTQVRLEGTVTATVSPASAQVSTGKTQPFTAPVVGRQNVARSPELPLPDAIAAAPVVGRQNVARSAELPALPSAVAAAPLVGRQNVARSAELPPLPDAVAAAPVVGQQNVARSAELPQLPDAVAAAPKVKKQNTTRQTELPLLLGAVAAAPVVGQQNVARSTELPPLPVVVAAAPVVGRPNVARTAELPPLPDVIAAAPVVGRLNVPRSAELPPLPDAVAAAPAVGKQNVVRSAVLAQLPDAVAAAHVGTVAGTPQSSMVTYQNGQLTINAETSTLAEVLKLVAEKTGAEIDVPPGSGLDRIIEHAGPGRAEDVLASLLNGSPFDFVIVSSPQPPHDPTQVLLFLHAAATPASPPPQVSADQTSAAAQPKPFGNPLLYIPAGSASAPVLPQQPGNASLQPPSEPLSRDVLEQMMKDRIRRANEQFQKQ